MSMVRDVSVSCAELKLVTVRVARPKQRSTMEEPGLEVRAPVGVGGGQVRYHVRNSRGTRATGLPSWVRAQEAFGTGSVGG